MISPVVGCRRRPGARGLPVVEEGRLDAGHIPQSNVVREEGDHVRSEPELVLPPTRPGSGLIPRAFARAASLMLMVGALACEEAERPDPAEGVEEPEASAAAMAETAECVNDADGYVIRYPASWHVNIGDGLAPCSLFDPEPIELPEASEIPLDIAVFIGVEPVPFQTLSRDVLGRRDLSRHATTVDGRDAVRLESETTGEGLHDAGIRFHQVAVDLGDRTFVAATYGVGTLPLDVKRALLDRMMATVRFQEPD